MLTLAVKDVFFTSQEHNMAQFTFIWKGIRRTSSGLPQGYGRSPTVVRDALAKVSTDVSSPPVDGYSNDVLLGGENSEEVRRTMEGVREKSRIRGLSHSSVRASGTHAGG